MKTTNQQIIRKRQLRIEARLKDRAVCDRGGPVLRGVPLYEMSDRATATAAGGIGAIHLMARRLGLPKAIDSRFRVLKDHQPYHESDHVLSLAYNILAGGRCIEDLARLREDEALMNMLGAERLPAPSTAGDFVRRPSEADIDDLQDALNDVRLKVWDAQPSEFRKLAIIDVDGTVVPTTGEKKSGIDYCYHKKQWGYHPLLVSLANTREPIFIVNRSGNVPSHAGSAAVIDRAIDLVEPVFDDVLLRGDTDFSLTTNFDRWTAGGVRFVFGYDAHKSLVRRATEAPRTAWKHLARTKKGDRSTSQRKTRENTKEELVVAKGWKNIVLLEEHYAEFKYEPEKCKQPYRMIVLRKEIEERKGQIALITNYRYFFYVTNDMTMSAREVIFSANDRCEQENLIDQLKNGVGAMRAPVHDLNSNWAYMVIAALAWSLKAWFGLTLLNEDDRESVVRMEFRGFQRGVIQVPAQVIRSGRQLRVKILAFTSMVGLIFSSVSRLNRAASP